MCLQKTLGLLSLLAICFHNGAIGIAYEKQSTSTFESNTICYELTLAKVDNHSNQDISLLYIYDVSSTYLHAVMNHHQLTHVSSWNEPNSCILSSFLFPFTNQSHQFTPSQPYAFLTFPKFPDKSELGDSQRNSNIQYIVGTWNLELGPSAAEWREPSVLVLHWERRPRRNYDGDGDGVS
jgi:hypothetical protein